MERRGCGKKFDGWYLCGEYEMCCSQVFCEECEAKEKERMNDEEFAAGKVVKHAARAFEDALNAYPGKLEVKIEQGWISAIGGPSQSFLKVVVKEEITKGGA